MFPFDLSSNRQEKDQVLQNIQDVWDLQSADEILDSGIAPRVADNVSAIMDPHDWHTDFILNLRIMSSMMNRETATFIILQVIAQRRAESDQYPAWVLEADLDEIVKSLLAKGGSLAKEESEEESEERSSPHAAFTPTMASGAHLPNHDAADACSAESFSETSLDRLYAAEGTSRARVSVAAGPRDAYEAMLAGVEKSSSSEAASSVPSPEVKQSRPASDGNGSAPGEPVPSVLLRGVRRMRSPLDEDYDDDEETSVPAQSHPLPHLPFPDRPLLAPRSVMQERAITQPRSLKARSNSAPATAEVKEGEIGERLERRGSNPPSEVQFGESVSQPGGVRAEEVMSQKMSSLGIKPQYDEMDLGLDGRPIGLPGDITEDEQLELMALRREKIAWDYKIKLLGMRKKRRLETVRE